MPGETRLDVPGALHHIMVQGINKSAIFRDDKARELICALQESAFHSSTSFLGVTGTIQKRDGVVHVIAESF